MQIDTRIKHGQWGSPTYESWHMMIQRCTNKKATDYKNYGGRGIHICKRWKHFQHFFSDMGQRPPGTSLDRKNNERDYQKSNCKWATKKEQVRNMRTNVRISREGETLCVAEWCEKIGIQRATFNNRVRNLGWTMDKAMFSPVRKRTV